MKATCTVPSEFHNRRVLSWAHDEKRVGFTTSSSIQTSPPAVCWRIVVECAAVAAAVHVALRHCASRMHRLLATSTPAIQPSSARARRRSWHPSHSGRTSNWRLMGELWLRWRTKMLRGSQAPLRTWETPPMLAHGVGFFEVT